MIKMSSTLAALLSGADLDYFYLVRVGNYRTTTHVTDVSVDSVTYVSDGSVVAVDPPQLSSTVDRQLFKIQLLDLGIGLGSMADFGMLGKPVTVYMGVIDPTTGDPHEDISDYLLVYSGNVDGSGYTFDTRVKGSRVFTLSCTTPMGDLDLKRPIYTSQDYLDKNHAGDISYQQVYEGSGPIEVKWGKS
jgi:hypothetical protein